MSVDKNNPVVGDTIDRATMINNDPRVTKLTIISTRGPNYQQINGIDVYGLSRETSCKLQSLIYMYKCIWKLLSHDRYDFFYLYMTPTLALSLWPFRILKKIKIVTWFGHTIYRPITKFCLKYITDVWFNSNESMAPFKPKHLHLVGQGVREDIFFPEPSAQKKFDLITVGRISPIKKIEEMIEVLKIIREIKGNRFTLEICGDSFTEEDHAYKNKIFHLIRKYQMEDQVHLAGMISRNDLPAKLRTARAFIFLVPGGIGKASLEAMATGIPMILPSPNATDFFSEDLSKWFLCSPDRASIIDHTYRILNLTEPEYNNLSHSIRDYFLKNYTMEKLFQRIVTVLYDNLNQENSL
jgi:glycosyltransferase involved in cell wall biosynthesis